MTIPTDGRIDLDALAELARKATPGPWEEGDRWVFFVPENSPTAPLRNVLRDTDEAQANCAFIAALDPTTVLALIDLARRAAIPSEQGEAVGVDFMALAAHLAKTNAGRPTIARESDGVVFVSRDVAIEAMQSLLAAAPPSPPALDGAGREGIYIASKTKHAERWRALRASGVPIIATWIDEAGKGESQDLQDLWRRCLSEAAGAAAIIVYREPDEVLKGGWIELGAAASHGVPVFAVGIEEFTIARHKGIEHFASFDAALAAAIRSLKETP